MPLNAVRVPFITLTCVFIALTPASIAQAGIIGHPGNKDLLPGTPLAPASPTDRAEARDIFKELIEINTADAPQGSVTAASQAMEKGACPLVCRQGW